MTLVSEQELEAEPRSSVFPGKELGQLSICRREGGWGVRGAGMGSWVLPTFGPVALGFMVDTSVFSLNCKFFESTDHI